VRCDTCLNEHDANINMAFASFGVIGLVAKDGGGERRRNGGGGGLTYQHQLGLSVIRAVKVLIAVLTMYCDCNRV
jgi:hypothetical protein